MIECLPRVVRLPGGPTTLSSVAVEYSANVRTRWRTWEAQRSTRERLQRDHAADLVVALRPSIERALLSKFP
jgi:hypothetical protein